MKHLQRRWFVSFAFAMLLLISATLFLIDWLRFLYTPLIPYKTSIDYILPSGASVRVLANDLAQLGFLKRPSYFIAVAYLKGYANHLRAGEYRFAGGTTPEILLRQIANGQVLWRQITFIEGWTFSQMMDALNNNPLIEHQLTGLPPIVVMLDLGVSGVNPEGMFFPDTYNYTAGMSDKQILLQAYKTMQQHLNEEWAKRDTSVPYKYPYQAIIVASIIEKEAEINSERPEIAGVILRRLAKGMLLQMDSTVQYAMGPDFKPPLTKQDLKVNSPYNTYLNLGLPPTPIAMPSLASLHAALHPIQTNYLYFVSKGDGSHQFSVNYQQQQQAVAKYQRHD
jgi:UPF0755 protein